MKQSHKQAKNHLQQLNQQMQSLLGASPLQEIKHPLLDAFNLKLAVKRDDLLHPEISGNKWRKLKYNLIHARSQGVNHIVSFGGAYSNHIHALAAAGFHFGFSTTGIIRGESFYASNPTLKQASAWGMKLHFVTRKEYQKRDNSDYLHSIKSTFPDAFVVPEGGSNRFALAGVAEAQQEIQKQSNLHVDHIVTATGSGGTLAGLIAGVTKAQSTTKVTGIAVLKNAHYLNQQVERLLQENNITSNHSWSLQTEFHHGGYAKVSNELTHFCEQFTVDTGIPVEPIYTGKMLYALFQLIRQGYFNRGQSIVALHTGGLQGIMGLKDRKII